MEVSLSGLRKLGRGKEMDISWEWIRLEKNGQQQPRMNCQIPTRQERIRQALPTPWKVCRESRYGLTIWKHLQG